MPSPEPGSQFDQYTVKEVVARLARLHSRRRATDLSTGNEVAIKMPHPEVEGDLLFYQRFCREQEICENLDHPSVVKRTDRNITATRCIW